MKEGWTYKKLGEVVTFDKRFKGVDRSEQRQVVSFSHVSAEELKLMAIEEGNVKLLATGLFEGYTSEEIAGDNLCEGEVITIPTGGNANIKYYQGKFVDSGNILAIAKNANTYLKFVWYYLLYKNAFLESCYKGTSIKHPFMPDIWELLVPIPDIFEQRFIVSCLDTAFAKTDALKANAERQLAEARAFFQKALEEAMRPKEGWEEKSLKELTSEIGDGLHGTPKYSDDGKCFFVNGNNLENGSIEIKDNTKRVDCNEYEKYKLNLNSSTVFLSINGTIGKTAFYNEEPIILGKSACYINVLSSLSKEYLRYYLLSDAFINYAKRNSRQATIVNLGLKEIRNMPIPIPTDFSTQHAIVSRLDALSANIKKLEEVQRKTLAECDALKQAMLREVFE